VDYFQTNNFFRSHTNTYSFVFSLYVCFLGGLVIFIAVAYSFPQNLLQNTLNPFKAVTSSTIQFNITKPGNSPAECISYDSHSK
jgi:hypothetical protein